MGHKKIMVNCCPMYQADAELVDHLLLGCWLIVFGLLCSSGLIAVGPFPNPNRLHHLYEAWEYGCKIL